MKGGGGGGPCETGGMGPWPGPGLAKPGGGASCLLRSPCGPGPD